MLLMHEITEVIGADSERHRVPLLIYPYMISAVIVVILTVILDVGTPMY